MHFLQESLKYVGYSIFMPEKFLSFLTCCRPDALCLSLPVHQQLRVDLVREEDLRHVPPQDESDQVPLLQHSGHSGQWILSKMFDLSIMDIGHYIPPRPSQQSTSTHIYAMDIYL